MSDPGARWAIILNGGAKEIAVDQVQAHRTGCLAALAAGEAVLRRRGTAVAAVEAAIRVLENDPTFNAGNGAVRNAEGEVEMDAAMMDGATFDLGGVAAIKGARHPVTVARLMLREKPVLLVAEGAARFARDHGADLDEPPERVFPSAESRGNGHDTVGCVVLDQAGNIAAGTSTGGLEGCHPGRVGDSPLPGCGLYADNALGGVTLSGDGESIARMILAARVMQALRTEEPQSAVESAIKELSRIGGEAGIIVLDRLGRFGWAHNSTHFAIALNASDLDGPRVFLSKREEQVSEPHA